MVTTILIAIAVVVGVVGFTLLISFIINKSKQLDSKETFIHSLLPELDCGKCGCPNCEAFSKEVAEERQDISACPYILKANLSKANRVIKKGYINNSNMCACIKCKGGKDCKNKFDYKGAWIVCIVVQKCVTELVLVVETVFVFAVMVQFLSTKKVLPKLTEQSARDVAPAHMFAQII